MSLTAYHTKYLAYELTRRCPSDSVEKLANAVSGAQVDLDLRPFDAALFDRGGSMSAMPGPATSC